MADRLIRILFVVVWTELCLGGGGRFTAWGPLSLRMILFAAAMVVTVVVLAGGRTISDNHWRFMFIFLLTLGISGVVGLVNDAPRALWWEDVKPLAYGMVLPFFALAIKDQLDIRMAARVVRVSAVVLAGSFVVVLILIHAHAIAFLSFYRPLVSTEEIFFRGEYTFFYKGFLFVGIGVIFFFTDPHARFRKSITALLITALFLSFTRGFLLALSLTFSLYFLRVKSYTKSAVMLGASVAILFWGNLMISATSQWLDHVNTLMLSSPSHAERPNSLLLGDRAFSDRERLTQLREVAGDVSFSSFLIGHGFGIGVPVRPVHMEISYLEIFHKQGLVGLACWTILLVMVWKKFCAAPRSSLADSFFFGAAFVFFQSFTNQYINNPIGLSMVLLALVCLDRLANPTPSGSVTNPNKN